MSTIGGPGDAQRPAHNTGIVPGFAGGSVPPDSAFPDTVETGTNTGVVPPWLMNPAPNAPHHPPIMNPIPNHRPPIMNPIPNPVKDGGDTLPDHPLNPMPNPRPIINPAPNAGHSDEVPDWKRFGAPSEDAFRKSPFEFINRASGGNI